MALYFFDSSALVKRYVREQGSAWVCEITATEGGHLIRLSLLTSIEIASALARRQREGGLTLANVIACSERFWLIVPDRICCYGWKQTSSSVP
jgi:uncharacterized protein